MAAVAGQDGCAPDRMKVSPAMPMNSASRPRTRAAGGRSTGRGTRTVEWHLGNVFTKLGIISRRELRRALTRLGQADLPG
jgi:hypothetical protein